MSIVTTEAFDQKAVTVTLQGSTGAVAGPLNGAKMILATNQFTPSKTRVVADLTQPTFGSYAPAALTWGPTKRDKNNNISVDSAPVPWQQTGTPANVTLYGYGITDSTGATLLASELFPTPQTLVDLLSYFAVIVEWSANNNGTALGVGQVVVTT